jgi:hypothetical protein
MNITVKRIALKENYTIGKMYINDIYFCDTLEDKVRDLTKEEKIYAQTAIPKGTYKVTLAYSKKFARTVPVLHDVPFFSGIYIHGGVTAEHTAGCILIGENKQIGKLTNSKKYLDTLVAKITTDGQPSVKLAII